MSKESFIAVELKDGTVCRMARKAFNMFLAHGRIARFKRDDGWVFVGEDTLRDLETSFEYQGPERRTAL